MTIREYWKYYTNKYTKLPLNNQIECSLVENECFTSIMIIKEEELEVLFKQGKTPSFIFFPFIYRYMKFQYWIYIRKIMETYIRPKNFQVYYYIYKKLKF